MEREIKTLEEKLKLKVSDESRFSSILQRIEESGKNKQDFLVKRKIQALLKKGLSPDLIKAQLLLKGISIELSVIHEEAHHYGVTEDEQVKGLIEKKLKHKKLSFKDEREINKLKRAVFSTLHSKGHCPEKFKALVNKSLSALESS